MSIWDQEEEQKHKVFSRFSLPSPSQKRESIFLGSGGYQDLSGNVGTFLRWKKMLENRPIDALDYLYSCITVISALLFAVIFALLYYW